MDRILLSHLRKVHCRKCCNFGVSSPQRWLAAIEIGWDAHPDIDAQ